MGSLIACLALVVAVACAAGPAQDASEATVLVHQLGQFQAAIDGRIQGSTGQRTPVEQRRDAIYEKLRALGGTAIPALQRGLTNPDVQIRRNVALYLSFEGGNYAKHADAALDVSPFLPQLVVALRDEDERVIELAAQALAHAGSNAALAVPDLARSPPGAPRPQQRRPTVRAAGDRQDRAREAVTLAVSRLQPTRRTAASAR